MSLGRTSARRVLIVALTALTMSAVNARENDSVQQKPSELNACRPLDNLSRKEAIVSGGHIGRDAKVYYTFAIEKGTDPAHEKAFREAVNSWNKWSDVTRLGLVEARFGRRPDVRFGVGQLEPKGYCAKHDPDDSSVRYWPPHMAFAAKDLQRATLAYVHEIGHVFGLPHATDSDLMNEITYRGSKTCEEGAAKLKDISARDAERARDCAFAIHYPRRYRRPPK